MNKTRESRKMAKELKKQQQQIHSTVNDPKPIAVIQQTITKTTTVIEESIIKKEDSGNSSNGELEIRCTKNIFPL